MPIYKDISPPRSDSKMADDIYLELHISKVEQSLLLEKYAVTQEGSTKFLKIKHLECHLYCSQ